MNGNATNLALHFDGKEWTITLSAVFPSSGQQTLAGVAPISANDVRAVGSFASPAICSQVQNLAIHWNSTKWSQVATPNVDAFLNQLFGVAAISSKDLRAVGNAVTTHGLGCTPSSNILMERSGASYPVPIKARVLIACWQ